MVLYLTVWGFNTGMVGYVETLTDPSYGGQTDPNIPRNYARSRMQMESTNSEYTGKGTCNTREWSDIHRLYRQYQQQ